MADLERVAEALAYIERSLQREIAVADVAGAVGYSVYHFCRVFNGAVRHTPYDYLVRRRLSEAARELVEGDRRVLDVALDYQFSSAETFSRAFKRLLGVPPSRWRQEGRIDPRRCMPALTPAHLARLAQGRLTPRLEQRARVILAGVAGRVRDRAQEVPALWAALRRELDSDLAKGLGGGEEGGYFGLAGYGADWASEGVTYLAGIEVPSAEVTHPALVTKVVPQAQVARFAHPGPAATLGLTLDYIHHTWMPKSGCRLAWPVEIEARSSPDPTDPDLELWIDIPVELISSPL